MRMLRLLLFFQLFWLVGGATNPLPIDLGPDASICTGDTLFLEVGLGGDTLTYLWSTGATTAGITVVEAGTYFVEVTSPNCTGSDTVVVTGLATPIVDFSAIDACFGESVTITNNSTSEPGASYFLDLGNGGFVNSQFSTIDYLYGLPNGADYLLELTITNPNGCEASDTTSVTIKKQPFAFMDVSDGCAGGLTTLTNLTIDTADASYVFDYGDGGFSFEDYFGIIEYQFDNPGTYQVSMFVQNGNGCASDYFTFTDIATSPIIDGLFSTTECYGDTTILSAAVMAATGASYHWIFGDGETFTNNVPIIEHFYEENGGSYEARLIVTNPGNNVCTDSATVDVDVLLQPTALFEVEGGCFDAPILITNNSTGTSPVTQIAIDYGNGEQELLANFPNMEYEYLESGLYTLQIQISNGNGCTDADTFEVGVSNLPPASFTGLEMAYCLGDPQDTLFGTPPGGMFTGMNVLDDPYFSDGQGLLDPSQTASEFFVYYTFVDPLTQCISVDSQMVEQVYDLPSIQIDGIDVEYCEGGPIDTLFAVPEGGIFTGPFITDQLGGEDGMGLFRPLNDGEFVIAYTFIDDNGCANARLADVLVKKAPDIEFDPDTIYLQSGEVLNVTGGSAPNWSYLWSTNQTTPSIEVTGPGTFILTATDVNTNCTRTDTLTVFLASGVSAPDRPSSVQVFPNPFRDRLSLRVEWNGTQELPIQLIDAQGRLLQQASIAPWLGTQQSLDFDCAALPPGAYFLRLGGETVPLVKASW